MKSWKRKKTNKAKKALFMFICILPFLAVYSGVIDMSRDSVDWVSKWFFLVFYLFFVGVMMIPLFQGVALIWGNDNLSEIEIDEQARTITLRKRKADKEGSNEETYSLDEIGIDFMKYAEVRIDLTFCYTYFGTRNQLVFEPINKIYGMKNYPDSWLPEQVEDIGETLRALNVSER